VNGAYNILDTLCIQRCLLQGNFGLTPVEGYVRYSESSSPLVVVYSRQRDAGKARWGELPTAAPVASDNGQALLERGWEATKEEFERNLDRVKEAIDELSDEEIMRDEDLARHAFHKVGAYDGPTIFLYTEHGTGIRHRGQLDRLLEKSEVLWIVPADVHF